MPVEAERPSSTVFGPKRAAAEHVTPILASSAHAPAGLDWQAFSAAYFPSRRRHDLEALVAYGVYRRSQSGAARFSDEPVRTTPGRGPRDARAPRNWEGEGGTTPSPNGP